MTERTRLPKAAYELPGEHTGNSGSNGTERGHWEPHSSKHNERDVVESDVAVILEGLNAEDANEKLYFQEQAKRLGNHTARLDTLVSVIQDEINSLGEMWNIYQQMGYENDSLVQRAKALDILIGELDFELVQNKSECNEEKLGIIHQVLSTGKSTVASSLDRAMEVRPRARNVVVGAVATCAIAGVGVPAAAASEMPSTIQIQAKSEKYNSADARYAKILNLLARGEGTGANYNAHYGNGGSHSPHLTSMSINQVLAWQNSVVHQGWASNAAGRYQFLGTTLRGTANKYGINRSAKFTGAMQDRLAVDKMRDRGLGSYLSGRISDRQFAHNLSQEWASFPKMTGSNPSASYYGHDGLNHAHVSISSVLSAIDSIKQNHPPHHPKHKSHPKPKPAHKPAPKHVAKHTPAPKKHSAPSNGPVDMSEVSAVSFVNAPAISFVSTDFVTHNKNTTPATTAPTAPSGPDVQPVSMASLDDKKQPDTSGETITPVTADLSPSQRLTKSPEGSVFENILRVPSGGIGHDIYSTNQTDLAAHDGIKIDALCSLGAAVISVSSIEHNPNISLKDMHQGSIASGSYSDVTGAQHPFKDKWLEYLHSTYGVSTETVLDQNQHKEVTPDVLTQVDSDLAEGKIMIVHSSKYFSYSGKNVTTAGHFFVIYAKADGKYYVANTSSRSDTGKGFTESQIMDWVDGVYAVGESGGIVSPMEQTPAQDTSADNKTTTTASHDADSTVTVLAPVDFSNLPVVITHAPVETPSTVPTESTTPSSQPSASTESTDPSAPIETTPSDGTTSEPTELTDPSTTSSSASGDTSETPVDMSGDPSSTETSPSSEPTQPSTPTDTSEAPVDMSGNPSTTPTTPPSATPTTNPPSAKPTPAPKKHKLPEHHVTPKKHKTPEHKAKPKLSAEQQAAKTCREAGTIYRGSAEGYASGKDQGKIFVCELPSAISHGSVRVNVDIAKNVVAAVHQLHSEGIHVSLISGFRSQQEQHGLRVGYHCSFPDGLSTAGCVHPVATPGWSNHQTGKAVDVQTSGNLYGRVRQVFEAHGLYNNVPGDSNHFSANGR